jgi:hypothetical protein
MWPHGLSAPDLLVLLHPLRVLLPLLTGLLLHLLQPACHDAVLCVQLLRLEASLLHLLWQAGRERSVLSVLGQGSMASCTPVVLCTAVPRRCGGTVGCLCIPKPAVSWRVSGMCASVFSVFISKQEGQPQHSHRPCPPQPS